LLYAGTSLVRSASSRTSASPFLRHW
jgi:hypothetical protein